jgi:Mor family transcriptional regulator
MTLTATCPHCGKTFALWQDAPARNEAIVREADAGATYVSLSKKYGLSSSRVSSIVKRAHRPPPRVWGIRP